MGTADSHVANYSGKGNGEHGRSKGLSTIGFIYAIFVHIRRVSGKESHEGIEAAGWEWR